MVHRTASSTFVSVLMLGLLFGITGCNTESADTGAGAASVGSTVAAPDSGTEASPDGSTNSTSYSGSASKTAIVSWTPPTQRTDGSALTDLAGYRVYYGRSLNAMSRILDIRNPGQTSQFIDDLETGTWYFAVTAFSADGLESEMSELAAKRIL